MATRTLAARRRRSIALGVALLVVLLLALRLAITSTNGLPGSARTEAEAAFSNTGPLQKGDDVRVAEVRVGQVSRIQLVEGKPLVTLSFDGQYDLYGNATAEIGQRSALGQNYVDVNPGTPSAGRLAADAVIPSVKDGGAADVTDLLQVLDARHRAALRSTLIQTGGGANGQGQNLNDALGALPHELPDLSTISRALSTSNGANVRRLLVASSDASQSFAGQQHQVAELLRHVSRTVAALGTDQGRPIGETLRLAPSSLGELRRGLGALDVPLDTTSRAMAALRPASASLGRATPDLRRFLREAVEPLGKVSGVANQAIAPVDALTHLMSDARPLAPQVGDAFSRASTPLAVLAPYAPEISQFFSNITDALHQGDRNGHWLRLLVILNGSSVSLPVANPLGQRDPYPAPGQSAHDGTSGGNR